MATRFEFILHGADNASLRAAGEETMEEIQRLEQELGFRQSGSEIRWLNDRAAAGPVKVSPMLFDLLQRSAGLSRETAGTFDVTIAPLMHCWGLAGGEGRFPTAAEVNKARGLVGVDQLLLDPGDRTVRFRNPGVLLDLGSVGKGYALDVAAEWLRDLGVENALIHGGTSTAYAIGRPPDGGTWTIAIVRPEDGPVLGQLATEPRAEQILARVPLADGESLSVSAVWGKSFHHEGTTYGHVIDPRSGWPVSGACLSAVVLPSATDTDALSTALLTLGREGHETLRRSRPGIRTLVALPEGEDGGYEVVSNGIED